MIELTSLEQFRTALDAAGEQDRPKPPGVRRAEEDGYTVDLLIHASHRTQVWRGVSPDGVDVMVKVPATTGLDVTECVLQLQEEYRLLGDMTLAGLAQRDGFCSEGESTYLATKFLGALDVEDFARRDGLSGQRLWKLAGQLVEVVAGLHKAGITHNALRPSHIIAGQDGRPYLIDFMWAMDWQSMHGVGLPPVIDPACAAPELLRRSADGPRPTQDIYALGKILDAICIAADCRPGPMQRVIARATADAAEDRYQDAGEMLAGVRRAASRRRRMAGVASVVCIAALALTATLIAVNKPAPVVVQTGPVIITEPDELPFGPDPFGGDVVDLARLDVASMTLAWVTAEDLLSVRSGTAEAARSAILPGPPRAIDIAPGGSLLVVTLWDGAVLVYSSELVLVRRVELEHPVHEARFASDGDSIYCWAKSTQTMIHASTSGELLASQHIPGDHILWDQDDRGIVLGVTRPLAESESTHISVVRLNHESASTFTTPGQDRVRSADFDPASGRLVLGTADGYVHLYEAGVWATLDLHTPKPVDGISASGYALSMGTVYRFHPSEMTVATRYEDPGEVVRSARFSVADKNLIYTSTNGVMRWSVQDPINQP